MQEYKKRLVEVNEILKHLSSKDIAKIPQEIWDTIEENMDKKYIWNYDESKPLKQQNVSRDTIAILSYINMEYLLTEDQKEVVCMIHKKNQQKIEEEKKKFYSAESLFQNKKRTKEKVADMQSVTVPKENIFQKIWTFLKRKFNIKRN